MQPERVKKFIVEPGPWRSRVSAATTKILLCFFPTVGNSNNLIVTNVIARIL